MSDIDYCVCVSRDEPFDRSREGWLIHRFCGSVIACDIFTQGIAKHPATAANVGFVTCDRHTEPKYLRLWKTEFPTKPGVYWIRNYVCRWTSSKTIEGPEVVQLVSWELDPGAAYRVLRMGQDWTGDDVVAAEWYGPLEPPT